MSETVSGASNLLGPEPSVPVAPTSADEQHRLKRGAVSLPETIAQSMAVMAPAMSGAFITYLAAVKAGGATPLAILLATGACLLIGSLVAEFALHLPSAGSLYTYTVNGLGSFWGFLTGWIYGLGFLLAGPAVLAGFAVFTSLVMADLGAPSFLQQWWLWFGVGLVVLFALSYFGVQFSTRSELVFAALTAAALLLLAVVIISKGGAKGNTLDAFSPGAAGVNWPLVFGGMAFGVLSFTGFETAAVLAEETDNPRRNVPVAVMGAVVFGGLFYLVVTYANSIGYGVREATTEWPQSAGGLYPLADRYASYLTDWVLLAGGLSALFCGLGVHNTAARTMYAMGREGVLPRALGRTHPRYRTPHVAILTNVVLIVVLAALVIGLTSQANRDAVGASPGPLSSGFYLFAEGLTMNAPPIMLGYALLSLAGIAFGSRTHGARPKNSRHVAVSVGSLVASAVAVYGSLYFSFKEIAPGAGIPGPYRAVAVVLGLWAAAGAIIALVVRSRNREAWGRMGAIFE